MGRRSVGEKISIKKWNDLRDITDAGMLVQIKRAGQAGIGYSGDFAQFRVNPDPASSEYVASRISEIDSHLGVQQRVKPWRPAPGKIVTGRFMIRFLREQTTLTYNLMLWNAPFKRETTIPATSIGVTRSVASNFEYAAMIAQNLIVSPQDDSLCGDVLQIANLRKAVGWLCMTEWHWVHVMFAEDRARVEVEQENRREVVAEARLVDPVEALGFVFSVDNEVFPGRFVPVSRRHPEGFDMAYFEAGYGQ